MWPPRHDGAIVAGYGWNGSVAQAIRWNAAGEAEALDPLVTDGYSLASAVSADGAIVAGYGENGTVVQAIRWNAAGEAEALGQLDTNGHSNASAVSGDGAIVVGQSAGIAARWDAEGNVQSIKALLEAGGVDMTGWSLSSAQGISADGRTIVGNGFGPGDNYADVWIVRDLDIIMQGAAADSLAALGHVAQGAHTYLGGLIGQTQEYALHHAAGAYVPVYEPMGYAPDPGANFPNIEKRAAEAPRWRVFGYAEGHARNDPDGGHGLGQFGASYALADNTVIGGSIGFGGSKTDLAFGGDADFLGLSGSFFAAHVPETGLQAIFSATLAGYDADISRGYVSGGGTATSDGETEGWGVGAALRIGYAFNAFEQTILTPFASIQATRVALDGYTETTGPFPAIVGDIEDTATVSKLGLDARHNLSAGTWLFGSAAWAHRFEDKGAEIDARLIGLFGITGATLANDQDWAELTGGISHGFGDGRSRITASATLFVPDGDIAATARIGLSRTY